MYFKKTSCPNCQSSYDEMLDFCPFCGIRNEANLEFRSRHPMTFIPWYRELILLILGLFGFTILNLLFSYVFIDAYRADNARGLMLINSASYLAFFLVAFIIMIPYLRDLFSRFKIGKAYLFGLFGFLALYGFSITFNIVTSVLFPDIGEGGNQSAVSDMVRNYPLISIMIVGIIGPICEELAYRVGLFTLLRRVHPSIAYIGTALIFGMIHFDFTSTDLLTEIVYLQNYIFAGLCFSFVYEKKGFAASSMAHVMNNMLSIIFILLSDQLV